jgi:hypothetical protein
MAVNPAGDRLRILYKDGAVSQFAMPGGTLQGTLFFPAPGEWLAYTPDGCWDGNTDPAAWLHFQTDRNVLALIPGDGNRQVPGLWKELCGSGW